MAVGAERPWLDRERIVEAAVDVADRDGIDALTLRRLASALGVHPTSIYHYLASKDAILDGVVEWLVAEAGLPTEVADWRTWVYEFAAALRGLARSHPGAFLVFIRRPAEGPVASRHTEAALDAFRRAGFAPSVARLAVAGTALAVLGLALDECPPAEPWVEPDLTHLSPESHPRTFETVEPVDRDAMWELVLDGLVLGLAHRLRAERRRP
ncbi:MAG: TetR/AcrR family transcriptional regulator [Mycobacteriales bacterium]